MSLNIALTILVGTCFVLFGSLRPHAVWFAVPRTVARRQIVTIVDSAIFTYIGVVLLLAVALRVALIGC